MNLREVMTIDPVICDVDCSLVDAATAMRDNDIGDVLVRDDSGKVRGIVTDRDLVVRGLAGGSDPADRTLGEICDGEVHSLQVDESTADAVQVMQGRAVRRVPVMDGNEVVGIVSLGDLAAKLDGDSVLGVISTAPPDR